MNVHQKENASIDDDDAHTMRIHKFIGKSLPYRRTVVFGSFLFLEYNSRTVIFLSLVILAHYAA